MNDNNFLTSVGRIVEGSPWDGKTTDKNGKPLLTLSGQPKTEYYLALAIAKNDPQWPAQKQKIDLVARAGFPNLFDAQGNCIRPDFHFKIIDGDSTVPNRNNIRPCDKTGFPGHWILRMQSGFAPSCCKNVDGRYEALTDPTSIKRGYYVRVAGNIAANNSQQSPGVYINMTMIELIGYGEEIQSGPSAQDVFGSAPVAQLPVGASSIPVANPGTVPPATNMPPPVVPDYGFPNMPPPPPPPVMNKKYIVDGNQYTADQLKNVGYTDEMINDLPF